MDFEMSIDTRKRSPGWQSFQDWDQDVIGEVKSGLDDMVYQEMPDRLPELHS